MSTSMPVTERSLQEKLQVTEWHVEELRKEKRLLESKVNTLHSSLRDEFAAQAMQSQRWNFFVGTRETEKSLEVDAKHCYQIADAMLKARG